jgi:hypothetical protein
METQSISLDQPMSFSAEAAPHEDDTDRGWSPAARYWFRFSFILGIYLSLIFPSPGSDVLEWARATNLPFFPWLTSLYAFPEHIGREVTQWAGKIAHFNMTYAWAHELVGEILVAMAGAAIWTALDRKRTHNRTLHAWLRIALRYSLFIIMWWYAWDKFVGEQFRANRTGSDLVLPFGLWDSHEMMWSTMGISNMYATFTGLGEMTGGFLLLWRRTTTVGALVIIQIMAVVAMLDFVNIPCFLVGLAVHFAWMSMILLAPDARRLIDFYIRNKRAAKAKPEASLVTGRWRWARVPLVIAALYMVIDSKAPNVMAFWFPPHPLSGTFEVLTPPNAPPRQLFDSTQWTHVDLNSGDGNYRGTFHLPASMTVVRADETKETRSITWDTVKTQLIAMGYFGNKETPDTMSYRILSSGGLHIEGKWHGKAFTIDTKRFPPEATTLYRGGYTPSNPKWLSWLPPIKIGKMRPGYNW